MSTTRYTEAALNGNLDTFVTEILNDFLGEELIVAALPLPPRVPFIGEAAEKNVEEKADVLGTVRPGAKFS